jgi:hypothetical protein
MEAGVWPSRNPGLKHSNHALGVIFWICMWGKNVQPMYFYRIAGKWIKKTNFIILKFWTNSEDYVCKEHESQQFINYY